MKLYYYVTWEKNHVQQSPQKCYTFEEAREVARRLLAAQVPNVERYTAPIRNGVNTGYRNAVADFVDGFFKDPDFFHKKYSFSFGDDPEDYAEAIRVWDEKYGEWDEVIPEDPLEDIDDGYDGWTRLQLGNHKEFRLTSRYWFQEANEDDSFELCCDGLLVGVTIALKFGPLINEKQNAHNIFLVQAALGPGENDFKTVDEICETIRYESLVAVSPNTVRAQIQKLKKMGFEVKMKEEKYTADGFSHQQTRKKYFLADDACGAAQKGDFSRSEYPMMVYLVLRDSGVPLSQQAILDAIFKRFGVEMQRQTVGRHVKLLQEMGCNITYDGKNGYKMN